MSAITYGELSPTFRKGLRNGNGRKRDFLDKALYRASLCYAKHRGSIVNGLISEKLAWLVEKLKGTKGMKIFKRGFKKAVEMLEKYEENGHVHMGASDETLVEEPQLYLLARDDEVRLSGEGGDGDPWRKSSGSIIFGYNGGKAGGYPRGESEQNFSKRISRKFWQKRFKVLALEGLL